MSVQILDPITWQINEQLRTFLQDMPLALTRDTTIKKTEHALKMYGGVYQHDCLGDYLTTLSRAYRAV